MLTKEHLKFRVRAGRVVPLFLEQEDLAALSAARDVAAALEAGVGRTVDEVEELCDEASQFPVAPAFSKLLLDQAEVGDDDPNIEVVRWRAFAAASALRRTGRALDPAAFRGEVAAAVGVPADGLAAGLYSDLAGCRRVERSAKSDPAAIVARYNVAQVQGLLLQAKTVSIEVEGEPLAGRRELMRQIKFHRLLCELGDADAKHLRMSLSGPLSIFEQATGYGLRLANFFPHLLHLENWRLEAAVTVKRRALTLKLSSKDGLVPTIGRRGGHVPEELTAFVESFNEQHRHRWRAGLGDQMINVGRESYCFPDLTITSYDEQEKIHVELFHRWHRSQLASRLNSLEKSSHFGLLIGVSKSLAGQKEATELLKNSAWFTKFGFQFSEFPTPRAVSAALAQAIAAVR